MITYAQRLPGWCVIAAVLCICIVDVNAEHGVSFTPAAQDMLREASVIGVLLVAHYAACLYAVFRWWPQHEDPWSLASTLAASPRNLVVVALTMKATFELGQDLESRWYSYCTSSRLVGQIHVVWYTLHVGILFMERSTPSERNLMLLHHCMVLPTFAGGLVTWRMHYWGSLNSCCEVTNIFLNTLYLFKNITVGGKTLQERVPPFLYMLNGIFLWLSFLVFRVILFTCWLYRWYTDVSTFRERTWDRVNLWERFMYPLVTIFLLGLSLGWFVRITKGLLKAVCSGCSETQRVADAKKAK